jgi:hypothetical protein
MKTLALLLTLPLAALAGEITVTGKVVCGKCTLKADSACKNVLQVKDGAAVKNYYLADTEAAKKLGMVCHDTVEGVTATGTVEDKGGKLTLSAAKLATK